MATLLTQIEEAVGLRRRIAIFVLIETAMGMVKCEEIATACPERMEAMVFGVADYAASLQSHTTSIGGPNPDYAMLADREEILLSARARAPSRRPVALRSRRGSRSSAGPTGCVRSTGRSATSPILTGTSPPLAAPPSSAMRASGRSTPSDRSCQRRVHARPDIAEKTHRIIAAMDEAAARGKGAVSLDGRLIDAASIRMAEHLLAKLDQIEARREPSRSCAAPVSGARPVVPRAG